MCVQAVVTEVPCLPLGKLLADLKLTHVNFFSLDVEGAELSVLEVTIGLPLESFALPLASPSRSPCEHQPPQQLFSRAVVCVVNHGCACCAQQHKACADTDADGWLLLADHRFPAGAL